LGASPAETNQATPEVETPLVFSGRELAKARRQVPDPPLVEAAALRLTDRQPDPLPAVLVLPPETEPKHRGFFGKVKGFFGAIFR